MILGMKGCTDPGCGGEMILWPSGVWRCESCGRVEGSGVEVEDEDHDEESEIE